MITRFTLGILCTVLAATGWADRSVTQFTGRMFTTPEERNILDKMRQDIEKEASQQKRMAEGPKPIRRASPLRVDGLVVRRDGQSTVWVDGRPVSSLKGREQGIQIESGQVEPAEVSVRLPDKAEPVHLRPGQRYNPRTGQVTESFGIVKDDADDGTEAARNAIVDD